MFVRRVKLFTLLGFEVSIDLSWIIIAGLVTWSLVEGLFPYLYPGLTIQTYWQMGIVGALLFFFSIIFHEFCHSLVARKFGIPMHGITLFIFGGVAEMNEEPPNPQSEFFMAIAGPLSSILLAGIFYLIYLLGIQRDWSIVVQGLARYLAWINAVLAGFNLLPAFPLDGGRILRSILWWHKKDLRWATDFCPQRFRFRHHPDYFRHIEVCQRRCHWRHVVVFDRFLSARGRPDVLPTGSATLCPGG